VETTSLLACAGVVKARGNNAANNDASAPLRDEAVSFPSAP